MTFYSVIAARREDIHALPEIERLAAKMLKGHIPEAFLLATTDEQDFLNAQIEGRLWVAIADGIPIGFAHVEMISTHHAHLAEIDVIPLHGQRGVGTALVREICNWAGRCGHWEITLTTFRKVPWNMPFYLSLGFEEIMVNELTSELEEIVRDEVANGLDRNQRVVMRYRPSISDKCLFFRGKE